MASGRARCTRKLRNWVVEQVESGQFPGVCWDDDAKTMFRIPWKHAGKQDFREDQDAAFFKVKGLETGPSEGGTEYIHWRSPPRGVVSAWVSDKEEMKRRIGYVIIRGQCKMKMQNSASVSRQQQRSISLVRAVVCARSQATRPSMKPAW